MTDYGIKVSLPNVDVLKATLDQCVVHSGYPSPKVDVTKVPKHAGIIRVNFTSAPPGSWVTLATIAHNYGYKPMVMGTYKINTPFAMSGLMPYASGTSQLGFSVDSVSMALRIFNDAGNQIVTSGSILEVNYYIFAEPIE